MSDPMYCDLRVVNEGYEEECALGEANGYLRPASPADLLAALVKAVEEGTIEGAELVQKYDSGSDGVIHKTHRVVVVPVPEEPK